MDERLHDAINVLIGQRNDAQNALVDHTVNSLAKEKELVQQISELKDKIRELEEIIDKHNEPELLLEEKGEPVNGD